MTRVMTLTHPFTRVNTQTRGRDNGNTNTRTPFSISGITMGKNLIFLILALSASTCTLAANTIDFIEVVFDDQEPQDMNEVRTYIIKRVGASVGL